MNIQAMMKQAQKLQKEMTDAKDKLDKELFEVTKSFVTIKAYGNKRISEVKINSDSISAEDIEVLQDLILLATNEVMEMIDKETEKVMGKYTQGMPGLF